jgi:hypothetical protein
MIVSVESIFVATSPSELETVTWLVHDCFFDLSELRWDEVAQTLELDFGRGVEWANRTLGLGGTRTEAPSRFDCRLAIRGVRALLIEDEAMIGVYDLGDVTYNADRREVLVEANIPCVLRLRVETVRVEVLAPAELLAGEGGLSWYTDGVDVRAWLAQAK